MAYQNSLRNAIDFHHTPTSNSHSLLSEETLRPCSCSLRAFCQRLRKGNVSAHYHPKQTPKRRLDLNCFWSFPPHPIGRFYITQQSSLWTELRCMNHWESTSTSFFFSQPILASLLFSTIHECVYLNESSPKIISKRLLQMLEGGKLSYFKHQSE